MEHACKDREQHIASTFAPRRPSPAQSVSRTVRVRPLTAGGLLPLCKKILGFIANLRQASYKSIAKTTSPPATVAKPRTPTYLVGSIRDSVRPEPVDGPVLRALEGGPLHHQQPRITPASIQSRLRRNPTPCAPDGTLTRPYCPHSGASATVSPWQSQSPTATGTSRLPMPTGEPASSLAAWSASMVRGASASISGGVVAPLQKNSWIYS